MKLRPIQEKTLSDCMSFLTQSPKYSKLGKVIGGIAVCPTGYGKSLIIAAIAAAIGEKVLVLQPTIELLRQNLEKIKLISSITVSVYSSSIDKKISGDIVYATIGSIKDYSLFDEYKYILVDECHLYPGQGMLGRFLNHRQSKKDTRLLGLTATPFRMISYFDGYKSFSKMIMLHQEQGGIFKEWVHITQISDNAKYWATIKYIDIPFNYSALKLNSSGTEFSDASREEFEAGISSDILKIIEDSEVSTIIFVSSIDYAKKLVEMVPHSACVYSGMAGKDRESILNDFKAGKLTRIFNVRMLSVGFDYPALRRVINCVATMSVANYYQIIGRGVRPFVDKLVFEYVDLAGNIARHGKVEEWTIENRGNGGGVMLYKDNGTTSKPTKTPTTYKDMVFLFGKYKGQNISGVSDNYLQWVVDNILGHSELRTNIEAYLFLKNQAKQNLFY